MLAINESEIEALALRMKSGQRRVRGGFKKAQETCKQYEPAGANRAGQNGQQQAQALKWVQCMRQNGVPNMPDPQADGRMLVTADNGVDPESQAFKDAQQKCRDLAPGGMG